jgi:hypothetical protein
VGEQNPRGAKGGHLSQCAEAKDAVMVREDYQHRMKFGSFKSRYMAKQAVSEVSGDFIDDAADVHAGVGDFKGLAV